MNGLLNWILWTPMLGALIVLLIPASNTKGVKVWSLINTLITLILTVILLCHFDSTVAGMQTQFNVKIPWISSFNIFYTLGIDGISLPMVLLNSVLFVLCILSSWTIEKYQKAYFALLLVLQSSVYGVFLSLDFFLFYVFWEAMLIPMFFLIGIWGGENREYAAVKFFIYTFAGSVFMLVGMIALYYVTGKGVDSFSILALQGGKFTNMTISLFGNQLSFDKILFLFMFVGFAIKVPVFPFHTWLPHAHVQAPTAISVILAGVLLKMGTYGILRICFPIFPQASVYFSGMIALLGLINIVYGALCAMAQTDAKRLVAYSSVSHMGFVMMGLAAMTTQGMNGAVLQMFNHGMSTAMMFLLIGILYERSHHRWIIRPDGRRGYSGLYTQMPVFAIIFIIGMFASIGLPGMSGFVSEALIFIGIYSKYTLYTVIALIGLLFGAAYLLWMFKRMFFGEVNEESKGYSDMNCREILFMSPLVIGVIVFGIFPSPIINLMKASVGSLVSMLSRY